MGWRGWFMMLAGVGAAFPAAAQPIKLAYEGYLGPFYIMSATVDLELKDGRYRIATKGRTEGFASWFFSWNNQAVSKGRRDNGTVTPESHRMSAHWNDRQRRARLLFGATGPAVEEILPPAGDVENPPVPEDLTTDTVDPLAMALKLMLAVARSKECRGTYRALAASPIYLKVRRPFSAAGREAA